MSGSTRDNENIIAAVDQLHTLATKLEGGDNDQGLRELAVRCQVASREHLALLETLRFNGTGGLFYAIRVAYRSIRKQKELTDAQAKMDRLSGEVVLYMTTTRFPAMGLKLDAIHGDMLRHVQDQK
jgi:hypothetical protein